MYKMTVGKGVVYAYEAYEGFMKLMKIALSFASPEKEKYFLFIYDVITWEKISKRSSLLA
jgi:hypothetical protein